MAKAKIALLYERLSRDEDDLEDKINTIIDGRKMVKNASYFAFTVTPKNKTLEIFGKEEAFARWYNEARTSLCLHYESKPLVN